LDARNDRHERIFKISRDITIESKRLIYLLQRVIGSENPEQLLDEALAKIQELNSTKFLEIAKELEGQDHFQFMRAYTNGLQEYIEGVTFYYYLKDHHLVNCEKVMRPLVFTISETDNGTDQKTGSLATDPTTPVTDQNTSEQDLSNLTDENKIRSKEIASDSQTTNETSVAQDSPSPEAQRQTPRQICVHVPPTEYMLGVADFTGELMRMAINSVGVGDLETPKVVANMLRVIHNAFSLFEHTSRDLRMKTNVLRQSMQKVENACYALTVRGSEIPKHMLKDVFTSASVSMDSYPIEEASKEIYD